VGQFCAKHEICPDVILTSPAVRAMETATIVGELIGVRVEVEPFLTIGMSCEEGMDGLAKRENYKAIMIVGHEPGFSELIAKLTGMRHSEQLRIRKASLTEVELSAVEPGFGVLQYTIPVRLMK